MSGAVSARRRSGRSGPVRVVGAVALVLAVALVVAPSGIVVLGLVLGCLNALLATGLILIYRSTRIINFAHGEMGGASAVLFVLLVFRGWNFFLALGIGLALAAAGGALVEVAIVRRFTHAPRLILTVVTLGISQLFAFGTLILPRVFGLEVAPTNFPTPLRDVRFTIDPVIFTGDHVMVIVVTVAAVAGLVVFLGRTVYGCAIRGAAENRERAALCGVPIRSLSTLVWVLAAVLSAVAASLQAPIVGLPIGTLVGPGLLLRGLAAAVIGRMVSMPVTVLTALGIGVFEQVLFFETGRSSIVDVVLLAVILVGLLLQRRELARHDETEDATWRAVGSVRPVPAELRRLPEVRWTRIGGVALLVGLAVVVPWQFFSIARQILATSVLLWAFVGVSLVVLSGWAGQISLGHFSIVGVGAAAAGTVSAEAGWDFLVSLGVGAVTGTVLAVLLGLPALRLRGFFLAVTTLGFAVATSSYLLAQPWLVPDGVVDRPVLFGLIDLENELAYYYLTLFLLLGVLVALAGLRSSRLGRAIVSVRDNQRAAQSYGIDATAARLAAFAVSGAVAGLAGGLFVHHQHGLQLVQYAPIRSLEAFTMAVIGGLGSLPGALIGAGFVRGIQALIQGPLSILTTGVGLIVVLLVVPQGVGSALFSVRDAALRRIADRRGIVVASMLADRRVVGEDDEAEDENPLGVTARDIEEADSEPSDAVLVGGS